MTTPKPPRKARRKARLAYATIRRSDGEMVTVKFSRMFIKFDLDDLGHRYYRIARVSVKELP